MCFAIAGIGIGTWLSAGAAVLGAYSQHQAAQAEDASNQFNARVAEQNADAVEAERALVQEQSAIERRRLGERVAAERGALHAKFAGMGLEAEFGTPADLVGDVQRAYDLELSILGANETNALRNLDSQKADLLNNAQLLRMGGKSAKKAGSIAAAGSLLGGAADVSSRWIQPSTAKNNKTPLGLGG